MCIYMWDDWVLPEYRQQRYTVTEINNKKKHVDNMIVTDG